MSATSTNSQRNLWQPTVAIVLSAAAIVISIVALLDQQEQNQLEENATDLQRSVEAEVMAQSALDLIRGPDGKSLLGDPNRQSLLLQALDRAHLATRIHSQSVTAWRAVGSLNIHLARFDAARAALTKAEELGPTDGRVYANQIGLLIAERRYEGCTEIYERALGSAADQLANLHVQQATCLTFQGERKRPFEIFRTALRLDRRNTTALSSTGVLLAEAGRPDEAVPFFRQVVALAPDRVLAWLNLGGALKDTGEFTEAIKVFERAIEIDPLAKPAYEQLIQIHTHLGEVDTAEEVEERLRSIDIAIEDLLSESITLEVRQS